MRYVRNAVLAVVCIALCSSLGLAGLFSPSWPVVKVTFEVVDDDGQPVSNATVYASPDGEAHHKVQTDQSGKAIVEGPTRGHMFAGVEKANYYPTTAHFDVPVPEGVKIGRRLPDVTRHVLLRPIINPVPMYAYAFSDAIPVEGVELAFDFLKADWVAPYGSGTVTDVLARVVSFNRERDSKEGAELLWRFPRPGDGMARIPATNYYETSGLRLPRQAPADGYVASWTNFYDTSNAPDQTWPSGPSIRETAHLIRIRSSLDDHGVVTNAMYGKITDRGASYHGIFVEEARPWMRLCQFARISFSFYVNPDGTRNIEFDPKRNLFQEMDGVGNIDRRNFLDHP